MNVGRAREQTRGYQWAGEGRGVHQGCGIKRYKLLHIKDNKDRLYRWGIIFIVL